MKYENPQSYGVTGPQQWRLRLQALLALWRIEAPCPRLGRPRVEEPNLTRGERDAWTTYVETAVAIPPVTYLEGLRTALDLHALEHPSAGLSVEGLVARPGTPACARIAW